MHVQTSLWAMQPLISDEKKKYINHRIIMLAPEERGQLFLKG